MPNTAPLDARAEQLYEELIQAHASNTPPLDATVIEAEELARNEDLSEEWRVKLGVAASMRNVAEVGPQVAADEVDASAYGYSRSSTVDPSDVAADVIAAQAAVATSPQAGTAAATAVADGPAVGTGPAAVPIGPRDFTGTGTSPNQIERSGQYRGPRISAGMTQAQVDEATAAYLDTPEGRREGANLQRVFGAEMGSAAFAQRNIEINYSIDSNGVGAHTTDGHSRFLSWRSLARLVDALPYSEYVQLQEKLWDAGFYGEDTPNWGVRDGATRQAFNASIQEASLVADSYSWDEMIDAYANVQAANNAEEQQKALDAALTAAGVNVQTVSDPAAIRMDANSAARQLIGRDLSLGERDAFATWIRGLEQSNNATRRNAAVTVATRDLTDSQNAQTGMGNYDSERAGQVGQQLAGAYGLTVSSHMRTPEQNAAAGGVRNSDHLRGMAVDLSGNANQMEALYRWAKANEGPNGLFRVVLYRYEDPEGHSDHVHLSFNTHVNTPVAVPGSSTQGVPVTGYSQGLAEFMQAIRTVESGGNYRAVGPTTRYGRATGAYQFLDSTWNGYGGYHSAKDAPQSTQDERAAQLMMNYYRRFGDWQLVAIAWHAGPGAAERAMHDRSYADRLNDGLRTTSSYASEVMGIMANGGRAPKPTYRYYPAQERREQVVGQKGTGPGGGKQTFALLSDLDRASAEAFSTNAYDPEADAAGGGADLSPAIEVEDLDPQARIAEELTNSQEYADFGMALSIEDFNRLLGGPVGLTGQ